MPANCIVDAECENSAFFFFKREDRTCSRLRQKDGECAEFREMD